MYLQNDGGPTAAHDKGASNNVVKLIRPRDELLVKSWLTRDLPERDYLLGNVLCSTSRWLVFGDTGVGKTLFAMAVAGAIASGQPFLNWGGRHSARVMYLDGELPAETFKERMQMVASHWGEEVEFYGYNREVLTNADMPPLNTEPGQKWLLAEIDKVKPDIIVFDSIMCLVIGSMSEEESWLPMKPLIRQLSAKRVAQIWLNHTGHDSSRSYGSKMREWEMDTVAGLFKVDKDDPLETSMRIEFPKARLRTPETASQFAPSVIRLVDGEWTREDAEGSRRGKREKSDAQILQDALVAAYGRLADTGTHATGFNGKAVIKVKVTDLTQEVKSRGFLDLDGKGHITGASREAFRRAKNALIGAEKLIESNGSIWRP